MTRLRTQKRDRPIRENVPQRLGRLVEFKGMRQLSLKQYRENVREMYDGPAGAVLALGSLVCLHEPLVGHMLKRRQFDVSPFQTILDIGSGAGQILGHLLRVTRPETRLVACDISHQMLLRARVRIKSRRPVYLAADLMQLPFVDESFDCITCGWVLEHLPEPAPGLAEFNRVLRPGGRALILATEDTFSGAIVSRAWKCRTFNRAELENTCDRVGLPWHEQYWFSRIHRFFKMGGIMVEARKPTVAEPQQPR